MPIPVYAIQWDDGKPVAEHEFTVPAIEEKGGYREITSVDCFSTREKVGYSRRCNRGLPPPRRRMHIAFYEPPYSWGKANLPRSTYESVADFFDAIQYDRKKKKYYLNQTEGE